KAIPVDQVERDCPIRRINGDHLIMYETVGRVSAWEVDSPILYGGGDDGRVVNDAVDVYQWAVVRVADRAWLGDPGWEWSFLRAGHEHPVWTEVYEAGLKEECPCGGTRCGACGNGVVRQFFGEIHAEAVRLRLVAYIEDDVPHGLQTKRCLHRTLVKRQRDRSSGSAGGNIHARQLFD